MADIAMAAGLSKPGVYHHFRDKDAIFSHVSLTTLEGICVYVEARVADIQDPAERLRAFLQAHAAYFEANRPMYIAAHFAFLRMTDEPMRNEAMRLRDRYEHFLRGIIAAGVESGAFFPVDPSAVSRIVLASMNSLARWHRSKGPVSPARFGEDLFELLTQGLYPRSAAGKTAAAVPGTAARARRD